MKKYILIAITVLLLGFSLFMTLSLGYAAQKEKSAYYAVGFVSFLLITMIFGVIIPPLVKKKIKSFKK